MSLFRRKPTEPTEPEHVPPSPETHPEQFAPRDEPQEPLPPDEGHDEGHQGLDNPTSVRTKRHTPETKARVAAALAAGSTVSEAAQSCRVGRNTIWRWTAEDPEFKAMRVQAVEGIIAHAAISVRGLGDKVIEAWERGLDAKGPLAVRTADVVSRRIPELAPHQGLEVSVSASEELARVILELDAEARGS